MSRSQLQDEFDDTLAELERLGQVWGDLSTSEAWESSGYSVIEWFKTAMSPEMSVPYSMVWEAFERLVAFRKQIIYVDQDERFELNIESLINVTIKHIAAFHFMGRGDSTLSDNVPWEYRVNHALEAWLMMRRNLVKSFGTNSNNRQLEASVVSLEEEVQDLTIAKATISFKHQVQGLKTARQDLETAVQVFNGQPNGLRLSHAGSSNSNAMLDDELEKVRQLHVETCDGNNEPEAENTTTSKRFAFSNGTLQETVRKLKNEIEVLQKAAIVNNDCKVYDTSYQSDALKAKERLAEAEVDLAAMGKANSQLVTKHEDFQVEVAALLRNKALLREKAATLDECEHLKFENAFLTELVRRSHPIKKKEEELASANARLTGSLPKVEDDHAPLSKSNEELVAEGAKKDIELKQAADLISRLKNKIGKSKEYEARLVEGLALVAEGLKMATSPITVTKIRNLMAVNLRLEEELKAANGIIGQIRPTLVPCSTPANTVHEVSGAHKSPDTAAANQIDFNENVESPSEAPVDPSLVGDTESDTWSTTMLTPPPGLDTPDVSYFPLLPRFDTSKLAALIKKGADGETQIGDVPNRGKIC